MEPNPNPYAAPASTVQESVAPQAAPALWNPNAAALWCLLFSPVFGAYLQMRNWQALGEPEKAQTSWYWCVGTLVTVLVLIGVGMVLPDEHWFQKLGNRSGFIMLIAWYMSHGKLQIAYVKERYGKDYPRKGWGAPLGIAVACMVALFVFIVGAAIVLAALGVTQLPQ